MRKLRPALPALACVVLAVVLSLAPTGEPDFSGASGQAPPSSDFGRWVEAPLTELPDRQPGRTALRWWQFIQKNEVAASYALLTRAERNQVSLPKYRQLIDAALRGFRALPCPGRSTVKGQRATFRTDVTFSDECPKFPLELRLSREGDGWRVSGLPYVNGAIEVARREATGGG